MLERDWKFHQHSLRVHLALLAVNVTLPNNALDG